MVSKWNLMVGRGSRMGFFMKSATSDTALSVSFRLLLRVTLGEIWLLAVALPVVATVRVALWILPSRTILSIVRRSALASRAEATHPRVPASLIVWAVEAASRRIPRATCLTQAIAAQFLLRCFGQGAQICFGVAHASTGTFRAHAWLECEGRPVLGGDGIQSLVRLPELPDAARVASSHSL